jgi:hypothetical protein
MKFTDIIAFDSANQMKHINTICFEGLAQIKGVIVVSYAPQNTEA